MIPEPRDATKTAFTRRLLPALPLVIFGALAVLFWQRLGAGDASNLPSALIGKPVPVFDLPALPGQLNSKGAQLPGFSQQSLKSGHVSLVNIFASWCAPCQQEHKFLMQIAADQALAAKGVTLYGLAYKDKDENTRAFLQKSGNPYASIGVDSSGRTGIDFGVYGVPETFIIKNDGTVAFKFIGPLSAESLANTLLPEIEKALK